MITEITTAAIWSALSKKTLSSSSTRPRIAAATGAVDSVAPTEAASAPVWNAL